VVAVINCSFLQVVSLQLARAAVAYPGVHLQGTAAITLLSGFTGHPCLGNNTIKLVGGTL